MTDHIYTSFGAIICIEEETGTLIWEMSLKDVAQMRARLSALQTEVEGRGEMIRKLREELSDAAGGYHETNHGGEFHLCQTIVCKNARALLAATAPVEGGTK